MSSTRVSHFLELPSNFAAKTGAIVRQSLDSLLGHHKENIKLLKIDEVAEYRRANPYIWTGYREDRLGFLACLKSLLCLHNETVNIWSHIIGYVLFNCLLLRDIFQVYSVYDVTTADLAVLVGFLVCLQVCTFLSATYHTISCHSYAVFEKFLALDVAGVALAIYAIFISGIYYSFWCQPEWVTIHTVSVTAMFGVVAGVQFAPEFGKEKYFWLRVSLIVAWLTYGIGLALHMIYILGGWENPLTQAAIPRIAAMYVLCGSAFVIYILKVPECLAPGAMDIFGHSHQWWHIVMLVAFVHWQHSGVLMAKFRMEHGCEALPADHEAFRELRMWPF